MLMSDPGTPLPTDDISVTYGSQSFQNFVHPLLDTHHRRRFDMYIEATSDEPGFEMSHPSLKVPQWVRIPQRTYLSQHQPNNVITDSPVTFQHHHQGDGIALIDVMEGNFDNLIGKDDPVSSDQALSSISLRLEVNFILVNLRRAELTFHGFSGQGTSPGSSRSARRTGGKSKR